MDKSLAGIGVVITRAVHQAGELASMLVERGANVYALPMIRFARHKRADEAEVLRDIGRFDLIIFTSANAVHFFVRALEDNGRTLDALAGRAIASIGPATSTALREHGVSPTFESAESSSKGLAEALGAKLRDKTVLLPRSKRADDELPSALVNLGADVREQAVYDTLDETRNGGELRALIESGRAQAILFASPSAAEATVRILGDEGVRLVSQLAVISIGPATTKRCRECTIPVRAEAAPHTNAGLVAALEMSTGRK